MPATARICLFAKPPRQGLAKTRLIPTLGSEGAARLARAFLLDSLALARSIPWAETVVSSTGDLSDLVTGEVWPQGEGDLGQRVERVLRRALEPPGVRFAIALGADTPGLPLRLLAQARDALEAGHDAVLGPAEDGGFYLLGLARCPAGLLEGLPWSRRDTMEQTRRRLEQRGLAATVIDPWFDVDRDADLERLERLLRQEEIRAPLTEQALRRLRPAAR